MFTAHLLLYLVETGTRHSPKPFPQPQKVFWESGLELHHVRFHLFLGTPDEKLALVFDLLLECFMVVLAFARSCCC